MAQLVVPALGESITEAVIGKWLRGIGEYVEADEPVVDLETDKITVQLYAPVAGSLKEQLFSEGDTVKVGDVVGEISAGMQAQPQGAKKADGSSARGKKRAPKETTKEEPPTVITAPAPRPAPVQEAETATRPAVVEPPARGPAGRRLSPSMRRAAREGQAIVPANGQPAGTRAQPAPAVPVEAGEREEVVKMSPLRKRIAERLVEAQQNSASLTTFNEIDMSRCMALRAKHKDAFLEAHGVKLGFMSFFVKAAVAALKKYPGVNAEVRGDSIVYKKHYDVGIAVGTDKGLVVPVLRDADARSFAEVESGIVELATKARKSRLTLHDLTGATFTITNGGIYGSMMSTPMLNYPQTGILGMHNIVKRPMVVGDSVEVRPMMYVALTYDHRVIDGKEAVQFLVALKERIEDPERLMFSL